MEIRVQRNDLAKELQLVQGIVERKSSIPILSERAVRGARRRDPDRGDRPRRLAALRLRGRGDRGGLRHARGQEALRDRPLAARERRAPEARERRLGADPLRARGVPHGGPAARGLPEPSGSRRAAAGIELPARVLRELIQRTAFAITAEDARYYLAGALLVLDKDVRGDGRDGRASAGVGRAQGDAQAGRRGARAGAAQGDHRARAPDRGGRRRRDGLLPAGRRPPDLRDRRPDARLEAGRGAVPGVREGDRRDRRQEGERRARGAAERHPAREPAVLRPRPRGQAGARRRQARAQRLVARVRRGARVAAASSTRAAASRSGSTRSTCSTSWASWAGSRWRSSSRTARARGCCGRRARTAATTATSSCRCGSKDVTRGAVGLGAAASGPRPAQHP